MAIIKNNYPKIDFALVGYTSASLFPHCMIDFDGCQMTAGIKKAKLSGLSTALNTLKVLQPDSYMPFAGTYIIGGSEYKKNTNLPIPEIQDAVTYLTHELEGCGISLNPVLLNFSEQYNVDTRQQSANYIPIDVEARGEYIETIARYFPYDFEADSMPSDDDIITLLEESLVRLKRKQNDICFYEDINLLFDLPSGAFAYKNLSSGGFLKSDNFLELKNWHRFKLDPRLLVRALNGPQYANWNNIEIGGLLGFSRKPNVYRMDVHTLINALHI